MIWYKQASNIEPQEPVEEIIKPLPVEEIATPSVQPTPIQLIQETQQPQDEMSATVDTILENPSNFTWLPIQTKQAIANPLALALVNNGQKVPFDVQRQLTDKGVSDIYNIDPMFVFINIHVFRLTKEEKRKYILPLLPQVYTGSNIVNMPYDTWGLLTTEEQIDYLESNMNNYRFFPGFLKKEAGTTLAWQHLLQTNFTGSIPSDIVDEFTPEQLNICAEKDPGMLKSMSLTALNKIDDAHIEAYFANHFSNKYQYASGNLKIRYGNKILDQIMDPKLYGASYAIAAIPAAVMAQATQEQKDRMATLLEQKPELLKENHELWGVISEEKLPEFFNKDPDADYMPEEIQTKFLAFFKHKYNLNLPQYYDDEKLQSAIKTYYGDHSDIALDNKYPNDPTSRYIKKTLGQWDSGYKNENVLLIHIASAICKPNPLDDELSVDYTSGWNDDEIISGEASEKVKAKVLWGIEQVHKNTQQFFKVMNMKTIPLVRYRTVSVNNVATRFSPENTQLIMEHYKKGKPFMLTLQNQPIQARSLASFSYSPIAVWSGFGLSKGEDTISIKEFVEMPVENVLALHGSVMCKDLPEEHEAVVIDGYGLPCTMIVMYGYDHSKNDPDTDDSADPRYYHDLKAFIEQDCQDKRDIDFYGMRQKLIDAPNVIGS